MAEFIFIPLRNIQNLLPEVPSSSKVRRKLEVLQSLLIKIQQGTDDHTRLTKYIIDLAYKVDDELDTSLINVKSYGRSVDRRRMISGALKSISAAYHEIRAARGVGLSIQSVRKNYLAKSTIDSVVGSANWNEQRSKQQHHSYDIKKHFVGRTEELAKYIRDLTSESTSQRIEIQGEDGWGKTSLGKRIYNDIDIRRYFQAFAWVTLPEGSSGISELIINLCREILKQLLSYDNKGVVMAMEEEELMKELREVLKEYKCLVIIDGCYAKEGVQFEALFSLWESRSTSKVLMLTVPTTQIDVPVLSREEEWELLKITTFGNQEKDEGELIKTNSEEIGRELVEMCNCLPQLLCIVGRVLSGNKFSSDHWEMVKKSIKSDQGVRIELGDYSKTSHKSLKILAFSYKCLPVHLKASFLYLGQFPKDEDINAEMLYQMWIAEGMVSSHLCVGEETTMDIAEEYLAELANRFLVDVQECDFSIARRFSSFRIHNIVREFCLDLERKKNTFEEVHFSLCSMDERLIHDHHWLSVDLHYLSGKEVLQSAYIDAKKLRSLLICNANGVWRVQISFPHDIHKKYKLLRVLRIENFEIKDGKLPRDIRNLIHLRFLSLKGSAFEELPSSIGKLQFLETLDLRVAEIFPRGIVVPNVLKKLERLKHLYLPSYRPMPKGEQKLSLLGLSKLETLVNFDSEKDELSPSEWKSLRHIDARVCGKKNISDVVIDCINNHGHKLKETFVHVSFSNSSLEESSVPLRDVFNCNKLHHLMVTWGRCELNEFIIPSSFSSNLIELCFMRCQIKEDPMPTLGKFPYLRKLVLGKKSFMGKDLKCESNSFPVLKSLKITNLMHLQKLEILEGSMPSLSCLEIVCCHKLKMIPEGLTRLKELKLRMPKEFNDRVRVDDDKNEGEDFHKVCNVPFIFLEDW